MCTVPASGSKCPTRPSYSKQTLTFSPSPAPAFSYLINQLSFPRSDARKERDKERDGKKESVHYTRGGGR